MYPRRKSDHDHGPSPKKLLLDNGCIHNLSHVSKKPRLENGHSKHNGHLPALPPITAEYEGPVFTHPSVSPQELQQGIMQSYDRLEFLGDAYIEIISSRLIWSLYKDHSFSAARMSQLRESLVKNETLSEFSIGYGFDQKLNINHSSRPQTTTGYIKLNGDIFEAYVAAVVLSDPLNGFEAAEDWLTALWEPKLRNVSVELPDEKSKGELQKRIGGKGITLKYTDEREALVDKRRGIETYFIGVYLTGWGYENQHLGSGKGVSKKAAGMNAAKNALENKDILEDCMAKKAKAQEQRQAEEDKAASKKSS